MTISPADRSIPDHIKRDNLENGSKIQMLVVHEPNLSIMALISIQMDSITSDDISAVKLANSFSGRAKRNF